MSEREVTEEMRRHAHEKLDEALDLYAQGAQLWINTGVTVYPARSPAITIDIYVKPAL